MFLQRHIYIWGKFARLLKLYKTQIRVWWWSLAKVERKCWSYKNNKKTDLMTWLTQLLLPKSRELWYIPGCPHEQPCGWASRPHSPKRWNRLQLLTQETDCAQENESKWLNTYKWETFQSNSNVTFSAQQAVAFVWTFYLDFTCAYTHLQLHNCVQDREQRKYFCERHFLNSSLFWATLNGSTIWHRLGWLQSQKLTS